MMKLSVQMFETNKNVFFLKNRGQEDKTGSFLGGGWYQWE
jgi:hypothetical protein